MPLKPGEFIVDGLSSDTLDIRCTTRPDLVVPKRNVKVFNVMSGSGDLLSDEEGYENTTMSLSLAIKGRNENDVILNRTKVNSLFTQGRYNQIEFWFDEGTIYHAYVKDPPKLVNKNFYNGTILFDVELSVKPWKSTPHLGPTVIHVGKSGQKIDNPTYYSSKPLLKITGRGDATVTLNKTMEFTNIEGHIYVDTENFMCYKERNVDLTPEVTTQELRKVAFAYCSNPTSGEDFTTVGTKANSNIIAKAIPRYAYGENLDHDTNVDNIMFSGMHVKLKPNTKYTLVARGSSANGNDTSKPLMGVSLSEPYGSGREWKRNIYHEEVVFKSRNMTTEIKVFTTPSTLDPNKPLELRADYTMEDYVREGNKVEWYALYEGDNVGSAFPLNTQARQQRFKYIGIKKGETSNNHRDYSWFLVKNRTWKESFLHIMYSSKSDGSGYTTYVNQSTRYVGFAYTTSPIPPKDKTQYTWLDTGYPDQVTSGSTTKDKYNLVDRGGTYLNQSHKTNAIEFFNILPNNIRDFPNKNVVTWSGNILSIEIYPNWRKLI